jgi:hypothetical protein
LDLGIFSWQSKANSNFLGFLEQGVPEIGRFIGQDRYIYPEFIKKLGIFDIGGFFIRTQGLFQATGPTNPGNTQKSPMKRTGTWKNC